MAIPFFGEVVSRDGMQPDPRKISTLAEMPAPPKQKGATSLSRHN